MYQQREPSLSSSSSFHHTVGHTTKGLMAGFQLLPTVANTIKITQYFYIERSKAFNSQIIQAKFIQARKNDDIKLAKMVIVASKPSKYEQKQHKLLLHTEIIIITSFIKIQHTLSKLTQTHATCTKIAK